MTRRRERVRERATQTFPEKRRRERVGRSQRATQTFPEKRRRSPSVLPVLLVLAILAPLSPTGEAEGPGAEWWGPVGMNDGWHLRIPLSVTNPTGLDLRHATVGSDIDLRTALIESGWVSSDVGGRAQLAGFDFDPESVRVVEYRALGTTSPLDGVIVGEVPSHATVGALDLPGQYHNQTNPAVHVQWVLPEVTRAGATRYFMVYADVTTNGRKDPAAYSEAASAPIDARYWTSRGTELFGTATRLVLIGLEPDTSVAVDVYQFGRPQPLDVGGSPRNVLKVTAGEVAQVIVDEDPRTIRLTADKPIIALGTDVQDGLGYAAGPVPSVDGSLLGTQFQFVVAAPGINLFAPSGGATVEVSGPEGTSTVALTSASPYANIAHTAEQMMDDTRFWIPWTVKSDRPIIVFQTPHYDTYTQFVSPHGAPVGSQVLGFPLDRFFCFEEGQCPGEVRMDTPIPTIRPALSCEFIDVRLLELKNEVVAVAYGESAFLRGRDSRTARLVIPYDVSGQSTRLAARVDAGEWWRTASPGGENPRCPLLLHTTKDIESDAFALTGAIAGYAGNAHSPTVWTPVGGRDATEFHIRWPVHVIAPHDATQVEVVPQAGGSTRTGLALGGLLEVDASILEPATIRSSKPVIVLPRTPGAYFAGIDRALDVQPVGPLQFRGYLPSIAPANGAPEPLLGLTGPGRPITFALDVENLAKDHLGRPVADEVRVSVSPVPDGWSVEVSDPVVRLDGGEKARVEVTVTPSTAAVEGERASLAVIATSEGNPLAQDRVSLVTVVRSAYGVDLWFDRPAGPKSRTLTMDAGEFREIVVVVRNTATVPDRILVQATPLASEWTATLSESGSGVALAMDPGETRDVVLVVKAPPSNLTQTFVDVTATSESSASVAAKITAAVRVRTDVRIDLDADNATVEAAPGETARFHVVFTNRGLAPIGIRFNVTGSLPPGWDAAEVRYGEHVIESVAGVPSGARLHLNVTLQIPENATRHDRGRLQFLLETLPQFAGDRVSRETLDLVAIAGARHDLVPVAAPQFVVVDAAGRAEARIVFQNDGNGPENLTIVPVVVPRDATLLIPPPVGIAQGERGSAAVTLRVPTTTHAGEHPVVVRLVALDGHATPWSFNLTVPERRTVELVTLSNANGVAGTSGRVELEIRNVGNREVDMPPKLVVPTGWSLRWEGPVAEGQSLAPDASVHGSLRVDAPRSAAPGPHMLDGDAEWATLVTSLEWVVQSVSLRIAAVEAAADGSALVRVGNGGDGDASGVRVALVQEGKVVDQVVIQRIPPNGTGVALLSGPTDGTATVLVDADRRYGDEAIGAETTLGDDRPRVTPGPPATVVAVVGAGLAVLWGRRWRTRAGGARGADERG